VQDRQDLIREPAQALDIVGGVQVADKKQIDVSFEQCVYGPIEP
jgi:hypothetical protein